MTMTYDDGKKYLESLIEADNWENVKIIIENEWMNGTYGPNLETVDIDLNHNRLYFEDYFSETTIVLKGNVIITYDDQLDEWNYYFGNGVTLIAAV